MALLDNAEIEQRLASMPGWERDGEAIAKTFEREDFVGSVRFLDSLVGPAEEMNHHPDVGHLLEPGHGDDLDPLRGRADGGGFRARRPDRRTLTLRRRIGLRGVYILRGPRWPTKTTALEVRGHIGI